jgi:hypothetical protein
MRNDSVVNQRSFGRRVDQRPPVQHIKSAAQADDHRATAEPATPQTSTIDMTAADEDLLEWTKARKRSFRLPWRQILFTASVCFGIASTALPESVNDTAQWLLYALAAASFCGGLARRRQAGG